MTTTTEKTQELKDKREPRPIEVARERLKLLSLEVKDLVEDGTFETINDAIMETLYKSREHRTFNSFMGWKQQGKKVKKGEKAFLLWSKPKQVPKENTPQTDESDENKQEDEYKFYGIAYLFSNAQVEDIEIPESEEQESEPQGRQLDPLPYD
ncbi:MAG: hypothetical protein F9K23_08615 [Bacteroidetes bacterium]|nr:MAG: hypothetical protein F9K23_08615 [Bacteroidota bacterium]